MRAATLEQLVGWREALAAGAGRVGWKLAFDFPEIDAVTGGREAAIGHLTTATLLAPGGVFDARGVRSLRVETEIAVEVGADGSVAGVAVALELVDVARPPDDLEGIVAGNVAHRACVIGPSRASLPPGAQARTVVDGVVREAAPAVVGPEWAVATVRELLEELGERLEPEDRILCGALTHVPVEAGDSLVASEVDGLGSVSVRIAR